MDTGSTMQQKSRKPKKRRSFGSRLARGLIVFLFAAIIVLCGVFFFLSMQQSVQSSLESFGDELLQELRSDIEMLDPEGVVITLPSEEPETQQDASVNPSSASGGAEPSDESISSQGMTEAETDGLPSEKAEEDSRIAELPPSVADVLARADRIAAGYDYDTASEMIRVIPSRSDYPILDERLKEYAAKKEALVPADVLSVPHIFYHSLVNDPDRAFSAELLGQSSADGMNAWMTTIEEFDAITQELYDRGYVYVRLRDLVTETKNKDGSSTFVPNEELMLPPDKKPIVLSIDDLSYYHCYETASFPEKLVLNDEGLVKCLYTNAQGETQVGDFDVVPRLNSFLAEHPDGAYRGARGLIAMTGYNGCFGYRTDSDYVTREALMDDQIRWLEKHPDFDIDKEIAEATKIADAIKAEGWEFASHTWGHLSVTEASLDRLKTDNEKWVSNVQNIVGPVDTIIFAHGNDIGNWEEYKPTNEKYKYFYSAGYHFYCNVDGSVPSWIQITDRYVRQGRIDMDGFMLYQASEGKTDVIDQLVDAKAVFDQRRPTPVIANGQG